MNLEQRRRRVLEQLPRLEKEAARQSLMKLTPTVQQMRVAIEIVIKHVIKHKRKVYGGYAIHLALISKGADAVYDENDWPDIDFLTPDPTHDIETICKELVAAKYSPVNAHAAFHNSTVKIRVQNFHLEAADVTYCWSRNYHKVPTLVSDEGVHYVAPNFQIMDVYKVLIDPVTGWHKIGKNVARATLMEKFYLLSNNFGVRQTFKSVTLDESVRRVRDQIVLFLQQREDIVIVDSLAYNMYVTLAKARSKNKKLVKMADVSLYASDPLEFVDEVIRSIGLKKDFEKRVFVPLLELYKQRVTLRVQGQDVLTVFKDSFCIPYQRVKRGDSDRRFQIGSYHVVLRMLYIERFFCSTNDDVNGVRRCVFMINNLQNTREEWLKRNNKTGVEQSYFQELQVECYGQGFLHPQVSYRLQPRHSKFPDYNPEKSTINHEYKYPNTSGRLSLTMFPDGSIKAANK